MDPSKSGYPHPHQHQHSHPHPHPHPPPQYTPNPVVLQPTAIPQQVHVVHVHQNPTLGPQPGLIVCYNCHKNVLTRLEYEPTSRTHCMALVLCIVGLIPCAIIPYFVESCQNGNHYCPNCQAFIGTYSN